MFALVKRIISNNVQSLRKVDFSKVTAAAKRLIFDSLQHAPLFERHFLQILASVKRAVLNYRDVLWNNYRFYPCTAEA